MTTIKENQLSFRQYRPFRAGEFIVVGADGAAGGEDYNAAQFVSKTKIDVPLVYHNKGLATEMTNELHIKLEEIFDTTGVIPVVAYERNNGGVFEMERLATLNRAGKYKLFVMPTVGRAGEAPESVKYGWDTNSATRPAMLTQLKDAIDKQALTIYDKPTIEEMFSFVVMQTSTSWKAQAESNSHDDLIMALAIAWQLYQTETQDMVHQDPYVSQRLYEGEHETY